MLAPLAALAALAADYLLRCILVANWERWVSDVMIFAFRICIKKFLNYKLIKGSESCFLEEKNVQFLYNINSLIER